MSSVETTPPASPTAASPSIGEQCYCLAARRAARKLTRLYDEALRPLDLNGGQFSMLTAIGALRPATVAALADHLALDRTSVIAALKPLLRRELVRMDADPRGRVLALTESGAALQQQAASCWRAAQQRVEQDLGVAPARALRASLAMLG